MSATTAPAMRNTSRPVSVTRPIFAKSSSHFRKMRSAMGSLPGLRIISMRSWLSESMIS